MKTQTVFALGILAALGLGAYWLYTKSQAKTNTTAVSIPIGAGGLTAKVPTTVLGSAIGSAASGLISDLGGLFSGGGGTQTVATPVATGTNYSNMNSGIDNSGYVGLTDQASGITQSNQLGMIAEGTAYSDTTSDTGLASGTWDDFSF